MIAAKSTCDLAQNSQIEVLIKFQRPAITAV